MTTKQSGYTIIEMGVYMAVLLVLLSAGYAAMYRCMDRSVALRRNADSLASALQAGERWRDDMRAANGPIQTGKEPASLRIPTARGEIVYHFETNVVFRLAPSSVPVQLLSGVKESRMQPDPRQRVTAWRWDVELQRVKKDTSNTNHFQPLFTFIAVPNVPVSK